MSVACVDVNIQNCTFNIIQNVFHVHSFMGATI